MNKRKLNIIWRCTSRVDRLTKEMLNQMYAAGCRSISFGVESGDDKILKKMVKGRSMPGLPVTPGKKKNQLKI